MRRGMMTVAAVLVTCLAAAAWAADAKTQTKTGIIKSVDADAKTFVLTREQAPMTFTVDDKTTYTLDGKDSTLAAALKPTLKTTVTYTRAGDTRLATKVETLSATATPRK